jgi:glucose-1-phosphate adenylyltransferase
MRKVLAIILGGGRGTRLHPLTALRAKPAVPIAGKYRLIDIPISNCINSGIQKIFILTQFNSASLNRHVGLTYNLSPFSEGFVEVLAAQQTPERSDWFQGTADAVRQYLRTLREFQIEEYLILSGDHLYRMNYRKFIESHRESGADITISVVPIEESKASDFGLLKIDNKGRVIEFKEKPTDDDLKYMRVDTSILGLNKKEAKSKPYIASMGIYVFKRDTLIALLQNNLNQQDFGKEIIPSSISRMNIKTYLFKDYWEDIGTIGAFYNANMSLVKYPNPEFSFYDPTAPIFTRQRFLPPSKIVNTAIVQSMVCEGCIIEKAVIRNSIIGIRSFISDNVTIEDSLIMGADYYQSKEERQQDLENPFPPVGIGKNTTIKKSIIDKNARIGKNVQIINKKCVEELDRADEGFWIRDGIVIVSKNAVIKDGMVI